MTVVATAGHVDHGKSTLVLALTGTDPDRLDEEKQRGLTIDLGFANITLPSGQPLSFIDVPGHTRFLRNMLSGVGAVDGCLFVVAATEGWKPQSEEHLRILNLLGLKRGVIALTKIDQVDDDLHELAMLDVEEHVEGTFLEGAPVVSVAAPDRIGLEELGLALDQLVTDIEDQHRVTSPRLWVDRSFAPAGAGTVVTGTLTGAALSVGDELETAGQRVRVRGLQSHHQDLQVAQPRNRVAVNLTGIGHSQLGRGDALVRAGDWHFTSMVDAELQALTALSHPISRRGAYVAYVGSGEFPVRMRVIGRSEIEPGATAAVRLYLARSIPLLPGDRFILRESGRNETVGGGEILDIDPLRPASVAEPDRSVERVVAERGWIEADRLRRLTGIEVEPTVDRWVVADAALTATTAEVRTAIEEAGPLGLDLAALDERQRAVVVALDDVTVEAGRATIGPVVDPLAGHPWVAALEAEPFAPPGPDGVDRQEVRELVRRGLVVEHEGVYFAHAAIEQAKQVLRDGFAAKPDGMTVAEIRDRLGTSRKYVLAILAHFDGSGVTRRREDLRIPGPRL